MKNNNDRDFFWIVIVPMLIILILALGFIAMLIIKHPEVLQTL